MTKIDIFSGFLGAGKTTLIKKLIKEAYAGEKVVLIENEFGEIGIDGGFLQDAGIEITEMNSGCICCSLVGDFTEALGKVLAEYNPDRVIIEPSGVGKLSDVIRAAQGVTSENAVLNCFTTVVDAGKCKMYMKNFGEFFNDQIEHASAIILSHTDVAKPEKVEEAVHLIHEHNSEATVVTTPWSQLDGKAILSAMEKNDTLADAIKMLEEEHEHHHEHGECHCHEEHAHHHEHDEHCTCGCHDHHHHHADEVFTSWGVETHKSYSHLELENILNELASNESLGVILRAKGIVKASDNEKWYYFDFVSGDYEIRLGSVDVLGRLCVIGSNIDEERIAGLFK